MGIHGQHAWQSLTRPDAARAMLDTYGDDDTAALRHCGEKLASKPPDAGQALAAQDNLQRERERLVADLRAGKLPTR
ncbi:hypothetical protein J4711_13955 [Staphylococcus epidermidis]|nr:hypothetical protein [Staphylococcus epidermidis]